MKQFKFEVLITCSEDSADEVQDILTDAMNYVFEDEDAEIRVSPAGILINDDE